MPGYDISKSVVRQHGEGSVERIECVSDNEISVSNITVKYM